MTWKGAPGFLNFLNSKDKIGCMAENIVDRIYRYKRVYRICDLAKIYVLVVSCLLPVPVHNQSLRSLFLSVSSIFRTHCIKSGQLLCNCEQ